MGEGPTSPPTERTRKGVVGPTWDSSRLRHYIYNSHYLDLTVGSGGTGTRSQRREHLGPGDHSPTLTSDPQSPGRILFPRDTLEPVPWRESQGLVQEVLSNPRSESLDNQGDGSRDRGSAPPHLWAHSTPSPDMKTPSTGPSTSLSNQGETRSELEEQRPSRRVRSGREGHGVRAQGREVRRSVWGGEKGREVTRWT